jgi:3-deoxy-manno-octulosonate cytidylyltransferase (CMP-KDO synthetase)
MFKIVAVIPARYRSSRFPGKPLADIHGKPMVWWVYQNATKVKNFSHVYVATDDERIRKACEQYGMECLMTSSEHPTGTDRVAEVSRKIEADYYANIQGDEPLVSPQTIEQALQPIYQDDDFDVVNVMTEIKDLSDLINSTVPKVVVNSKNEAIFFSRAPIPHPKNERPKFYKQVCVYVFKKSALEKFAQLAQGPIERAEDIEILRFLENGMKVKMVEVKEVISAVDTPADLEVARKLIAAREEMK